LELGQAEAAVDKEVKDGAVPERSDGGMEEAGDVCGGWGQALSAGQTWQGKMLGGVVCDDAPVGKEGKKALASENDVADAGGSEACV